MVTSEQIAAAQERQRNAEETQKRIDEAFYAGVDRGRAENRFATLLAGVVIGVFANFALFHLGASVVAWFE